MLSFVIAPRPKGSKNKPKSNDLADVNIPAPAPAPHESLPERIAKTLKRKIFENYEVLRDRSKRRKIEENEPASMESTSTAIPVLDVEEMTELERKWRAVLEFRVLVAKGESSNTKVNEIASKFGVGTGRNLRLLSDKIESRGSLIRKAGSGRPRVVSGRDDIQEFFNSQSEEWDHIWIYEAMANALKGEFGVGSTKTVKALIDHLEYRKSRSHVKPFLTPAHMEERMNWAKKWRDYDFVGEGDTVVVHIDEKWFYAFRERGKVAYLPPGVDPKPYYALSKTNIPHVMFLGAVAAPRDDKNFDGKIGMYHVGEEYEAKRKSKYHEKGEVYMVNINMDGDVFMDMVQNKLIPDIRKKCSWASKVIVQLDSAGGHRIGESLDYLNGLGKRGKLKIEFITQPTRSPDTNVLDLGIWRSMSSRVADVKYKRDSEKDMNQRIIDAVNEMWLEYDPNIIYNIFLTLTSVLNEIYAHDGGNTFKIPHTIKDPEC